MVKFFLEFVLFAGILCQIAVLATHKGHAPAPAEVKSTALASVEAMYSGTSYTMDPYKVEPYRANTAILKDIARKEAERIVQTGDYESLQRRLEKHGLALNLMGYDY